MALAAPADVVAQLGRPLTPTEAAMCPAQLENASDLVIGYCGQDFDSSGGVPGAVERVVALMVARTFNRAAADGGTGFTESLTTGPFQQKFSSNSGVGEPWLSAADKSKLSPYRVNGGAFDIQIDTDFTAPALATSSGWIASQDDP